MSDNVLYFGIGFYEEKGNFEGDVPYLQFFTGYKNSIGAIDEIRADDYDKLGLIFKDVPKANIEIGAAENMHLLKNYGGSKQEMVDFIITILTNNGYTHNKEWDD
jgi:hypothetical protein